MAKEILVVKKGKKPNQLKIQVKQNTKLYSSNDYNKVLDVKDSSDLATLFSDLSILFNAPIDKAFRKYKDKKSPFW